MKAFSPIASTLRASLLLCALLASACTPVVTQVRSQPITVTAGRHGKTNLTDMTIAASALQSDDISLATSMFEKVLETQPHNLEALTGLAAALALSGDLERARSMYERAAALAPTQSAPTLGLARIAVKQRRLDEAIELYQRVRSRDPSNALACAGLGTAWALKGDAHRAQSIYRDGLRRHPGEMMLTIDLGLSLVLDGQVREGANLLLSVAGEPGAPAQARQDLALAYGLLGNSGAADKILMRDLPRASTDDNLTYYKVVRARLDAGPPDKPVTMLPTSRHIGVQTFTLKPLASAARVATLPTEPVTAAKQATPLAPVAMNTLAVPAIAAPAYESATTANRHDMAGPAVQPRAPAPALPPLGLRRQTPLLDAQ
ncbi:tetratricopeptide repeat protein [Trinickia soli]|uniref:tetratricopeptide repeat protein n=1 Tax=Trinickia soli TaxID=380675 RepID=UPI003FA3B83D